MRPPALLLALALPACGAIPAPRRVDAVAHAESLSRHHGAIRVGPEATFADGTRVGVFVGGQTSLWSPGEPHYSARAPDDEFQVEVVVSVPIFGGP